MPLRLRFGPVTIQRHFVSSSRRDVRGNPINLNTERSFHPERDGWNFTLSQPALLPQRFNTLPAIQTWFKPIATETSENSDQYHKLIPDALEPYSSTLVPLELTKFGHDIRTDDPWTESFERFQASLSVFLSYLRNPPDVFQTSLYLAQCPLDDLPSEMRAALPQPDDIARIGRGDIYGSSLWMGKPPTLTPLHRDPNPNLFVQLAGRKVIRLLEPEHGRRVFEEVKSKVRSIGGGANMRGEEMMVGEENELLERATWGDTNARSAGKVFEATLESGDGLYIPLGWWHAVRGVGHGVNASVNWWFR